MLQFKGDPRYSALALLGLSLGLVASFPMSASGQQDDGGFRNAPRNGGGRNNGNRNSNAGFGNGNNGNFGNGNGNNGNGNGNNGNYGPGDNDGTNFPNDPGNRNRNGNGNGNGHVPTLSECTAILENAVRTLYKNIEPGDDPSPNELVAYSDLRVLRLYVGALEVAGWDLEQAAQAMNDGSNRGNNFRNNGNGNGDGQNNPNYTREKYLAFREAVRTLLFRVRETAVAVEHQVSFCDPQVARSWQQDVVPALQNTIAATGPLFIEQTTYQSYRIPGQNASAPIAVNSNGIPENAVDVAKNPTYQPYDGRGRGQGRYFEVRSFGGPVKVKTIRYRSHENSFGVIGTSVVRELTVDQVASPNEPIYIPCNRERYVDISDLEIEWENVNNGNGNGHRAYAAIDVIGDMPQRTASRQE